jgi:hypothetical protein
LIVALSTGAIIGPLAFLLAIVVVLVASHRERDPMRDLAKRDRARARRELP